MKEYTVEIGKKGEAIAACHLRARGYKILCFNYRARRCEIDIVGEKDGVLIFIEVKTSTNSFYKTPTPSQGQLRRLIYAANSFLVTQKITARGCRFDLVRIQSDKNSVKVEHLKDAFDPASFLI